MKRNLMKFALAIAALCCSLFASAQGVEIVGKVVDETGETLPGVNIVIKGQSKGTITDIDGIYKIQVNNPQSATLVFSYVGMTPLEEKVGKRKTLNVTLKSNSITLNEVVSVGYANMKRKDLTGSVASVSAAELAKVPVANIAQALAGRMSGVSVMQSEGDPNNSSISIRVRGGISLTQDNEPLYIIDGFPSDPAVFQTLNPSDIESIDVLKDASSTAIYGARGANGVVVINTKGGIEGKTSVTYEGYFSVKNLSKKMDLLNMEEYARLQYERTFTENSEMQNFQKRYGSYEDISTNWGNGRMGVDWQDETFRTALTHNHKVTVSGGLKDLSYNLSYSHMDDQGLMIESGLKKDIIRLKLDHRINKKARVNATINYTDQKSYGTGTSDGGTNFSKMSSILMFLPSLGFLVTDDVLRTIPNLDELDPTLLDEAGNTLQNPAASARAEKNNKEMRIYSANAGFSYELIKGLTFKNSTGLSYRTQRNEVFNGKNSINAKRTSINGSIQNNEVGRIQTSNTLAYDLRKGRHKANFMIGQEYITTWERWFRTSVTNLPISDLGLNDLNTGLPSPSESYFSDDDKMLSFFARVYWNFQEKYMLTATARADGSSKFGANNKWGIFPSVSFAWRMSEERFIKELNLFSDLKFRIGYGTAGNNRIPSYQSLALWASQLAPENNGNVPGFYRKQLSNKDLRWEANQTFNVGLDLGFFDQRLTINPEFYINRSSDLLMNATIPMSSGHTTTIRNIGATQNMGVDLNITSNNIQNKNFNWTTTLTLSHNQNKILALADGDRFLQSSNFGYNTKDYLVEVGRPVGEMYGFRTIGMYQVDDFEIDANGQFVPTVDKDGKVTNPYTLKKGIPYRESMANKVKPGYWKFENTDGDTKTDKDGTPLITEDDRQVIGSAQPVIYGGLNNTLTFKNFDFSIFLNYSIGNDILNATKLFGSLYGWTNKNTFASNDSHNRWVTIGSNGQPITDPFQLASVNQGKTVAQWENMQNANQEIHSWGVEDGSFLRISNVTLGYTIPPALLQKILLKSLRVYVTANNLFTFTKYSGYDPEVSTRNATGLTPGVDWSAYPRSRSFVVGLSIGL